MSGLKTTLEGFLAGTQEQSHLARALQQAPASAENTVDLAYHLMLANKALDERDALSQARLYLTAHKNQHEIVTLLESYARDSRALAIALTKDEAEKRRTKLDAEHATLKQQAKQLGTELRLYVDAEGLRDRGDAKSKKEYKQVLKQYKLTDKGFVERYEELSQQHDSITKRLATLSSEITIINRALELYDQKQEVVKERQQRMAGINEGLLVNLYAAMIQPALKQVAQRDIPCQKIEEPKTSPSDIKTIVHDVVDFSRHALDKMAELAGSSKRVINAGEVPSIPVSPGVPALPAPSRRLRDGFTDEAAKRLNQLLRKTTGMEFGYWDDLFRKNPQRAIEEFKEKYGDDEVFYE